MGKQSSSKSEILLFLPLSLQCLCLQDLLSEVAILTDRLEDTKMQLEREKDTSSIYHLRLRDTGLELQNKQKQMVSSLPLVLAALNLMPWGQQEIVNLLQDSNAFVSVLIDGDCMNVRYPCCCCVIRSDHRG